jgi:muramidase (phage lysozyme)
LARQRAQNAIERSDQALEPLGRISPEEGGGRAAGVDLVREYLRARAEGEADLQQKEIETQLKVQEIRRDSEKFALDVAKKVREFSDKAEQFARDVTKYEFETAKKVYSLQIEAADYAYAMWENAYKRQTEITAMQREAAANPLSGNPASISDAANTSLSPRARAYLDMIAYAEGTSGPQGYNTIFGGSKFSSFADHPRRDIPYGNTSSDAAGRYQFLSTTWRGLGLPDFSPRNQDIGATMLARNKRGVDIATAPFTRANIAKLAPEWASLPTMTGRSFYGQPVKSFDELEKVFYRALAKYGGGKNTPSALPNALGTPIGATVGGAPAGPVRPTPPRPLPARRAGGVGPAFLPQLPGGVDLGGLDQRYKELNEDQIRLVENLQREAKIRNELADITARTRLDEGTAAIGQQFLQPVLDARQAAEDRFATERQYSDLLQDGVLPALAEQLSQAQELERTQLRQLDIQIRIADTAAEQAREEVAALELVKERTAEQEKQLENARLAAGLFEDQGNGLRNTRAGIVGAGDQLQAQLIQNDSPEARRQRTLDEYNARKNTREDPNRRFDTYMKAKGDLEDLLDPTNQIISAANGIGDAFGTAFKDIASGSKTAQEALSDMFTNIGASFLDMAAQILAQQAVFSIMQAFGFGGGGGGLGSVVGGAFGGGGGVGGFVTGGLFDTPLSFAGGGYTGSGSRSGGIDGQGGFPAILHPNETVVDHSAPGREPLRPSGQMMSSEEGSAEITYSGPVLRFNEQDYVSKNDIPRIVRASVVATGREMRASVPFRKRAGM